MVVSEEAKHSSRNSLPLFGCCKVASQPPQMLLWPLAKNQCDGPTAMCPCSSSNSANVCPWTLSCWGHLGGPRLVPWLLYRPGFIRRRLCFQSPAPSATMVLRWQVTRRTQDSIELLQALPTEVCQRPVSLQSATSLERWSSCLVGRPSLTTPWYGHEWW